MWIKKTLVKKTRTCVRSLYLKTILGRLYLLFVIHLMVVVLRKLIIKKIKVGDSKMWSLLELANEGGG